MTTDPSFAPAQELLNALFEPDDLIEFRPIETFDELNEKTGKHDKRSRLVGRKWAQRQALNGTLQWLGQLNAGEHANAFFGVCPRKRRGGTKADVIFVRVLWTDIDGRTPDEVLRGIRESGLPEPSIVVNSGHGTHVYWLLAEAFVITSADDRRYIESVLARVQRLVGGDPTQDVSRCLRLPGFLNVKNARNGQAPAPCELVKCDADLSYNLDDLVGLLPADAQPAETTEPDDAPESKPRDPLARLRPGQRSMVELALRGLEDVPVGDRSELDFACLRILFESRLDRDDAWALVCNKSKFAQRGRPYFDEAWGKIAKSSAAQRRAESDEAESRFRLECVPLSEVIEIEQPYLWAGRIPSTCCTLIGGKQGATKNLFLYELIARITTGAPWPDEDSDARREPANVILLEAEESVESSVKPRLVAAGADCSRVYFVKGAVTPESDHKRFVSIASDCERIKELIRKIGNVTLVAISPITSYLGEVEQNSNEEVRNQILHPLKELAESTGVAVILLKHPNKLHTCLDPLERIGGSAAWTEVMRCIIWIGTDPDAPPEEKFPQRSAHWIKFSIGPKPDPLSWKVYLSPVNGNVAIDYVDEPVTWSASESLAGRRVGQKQPTKTETATEFILDAIENGPTTAAWLHQEAAKIATEKRTFSLDAFERSKTTLRRAGRIVIERKPGVNPAEWWIWRSDGQGPDWCVTAPAPG